MKRAASLVVMLSIVIAGCEGTDKTPPSTAKTSASVSPRPQIASVTLPDELPELVATIGRQVRSARTLHARLVTSGTDGSRQEATGELRTDLSTPTGRLRVSDAGVTHAVLADGIIYAREEGTEFEPGKPWMRISAQEIDKAPAGKPREILRPLVAGIEQSVREISTDTGLALVKHGKSSTAPHSEQLNGVAVRRYEGSTDTKSMPGSEFSEMNAAGLTSVSWKLWVDDRGLPQRFTVTVADGKATTTVDYADWGAPVNVQPPPASQVAVLG